MDELQPGKIRDRACAVLMAEPLPMLKATLTLSVGDQVIAVGCCRDGLLRFPQEWLAQDAKQRDRDTAVFLAEAIRVMVREQHQRVADTEAEQRRAETEPELGLF